MSAHAASAPALSVPLFVPVPSSHVPGCHPRPLRVSSFVPVPSPHVPGRHPRPLRVSFPVSPALALPGPLSSFAS